MLVLLPLLIALLFPSLALAQAEWTPCAEEGSQCDFSGTKEVRYGADGTYAMGQYTDGVLCSNDVFGDPLVGFPKQCDYRDPVVAEPPPANEVTLVPGTAMTWTDGKMVWAVNPFCGGAGAILQATSPAIDKGLLIPGLHCPKPGSAIGQPGIPDGFGDTGVSPCVEWYGAAPDIGACEFVPGQVPNAPQSLEVS